MGLISRPHCRKTPKTTRKRLSRLKRLDIARRTSRLYGSLQLRSVRRIQELKHKETHLVINLCRATGLALFVWLAAPAAAQGATDQSDSPRNRVSGLR